MTNYTVNFLWRVGYAKIFNQHYGSKTRGRATRQKQRAGKQKNARLARKGCHFHSNLQIDHDLLLSGEEQTLISNTEGTFKLFRIGDAVAARNTHAAIYHALRLVKNI